MNDLISVIVPVYNTGAYLDACIESIVRQNYPNLEIILVDDGSKDELTIQKCDELQVKYENVSVVHQQNGGSASARNHGIKLARGKYIGFIDSDDTIEPDMFSTLYHNLTDNKVRVALGGIATEENGKFVDRVEPVPSGIYKHRDFLYHFLLGQWHSACTNLYEKSLFDEVQFPVNEVNEDYMLNYWIFKNLDAVYVNSKIFYHYIRRDGSNTSSPISMRFTDWLKHTELILNEQGNNPELQMAAEYQYLHSNFVLCNKSLLTLARQESDAGEKMYRLCTDNLRRSRKMISRNKHLSMRYRIMANMMARCSHLYKWGVLTALKIKNR